MKKLILSLAITVCSQSIILGADRPLHDWPPADPAAVAHWQSLRFGMFIHWGPVSLTGHEISGSRGRQTPIAVYDHLYQQFNPTNFNADEWVSLAKTAGMKYIVMVCKHHDGFCLWDTKLTDYNIMKSPFHRDVVKELSDACKKQGIAFGAYYSVRDWYNTNWPATTSDAKVKREHYDMDAYEKYLLGQTAELIQNYGPLLTIWNDGCVNGDIRYGARGADTIKLVRKLQPDILINGRTGDTGDYGTPEQRIGNFQMKQPWESCMTVSAHNSWAWGGADDGVKSVTACLDMLVRCAAGDGNVLLNVGPRPDGLIDPAQANLLKQIGEWLAKNGESIYGTRGGPWKPTSEGVTTGKDYVRQRKAVLQDWKPTSEVVSTRKDKTIYVHILKWPDGAVTLPNIPAKIVSAKILGGGQADVRQTSSGIEISVAPENRDAFDTVVALSLDSPALDIPALAVESKAKESSP